MNIYERLKKEGRPSQKARDKVKRQMEELMLENKLDKVQKQMDWALFLIWAFIIIIDCLAVLIYGL